MKADMNRSGGGDGQTMVADGTVTGSVAFHLCMRVVLRFHGTDIISFCVMNGFRAFGLSLKHLRLRGFYIALSVIIIARCCAAVLRLRSLCCAQGITAALPFFIAYIACRDIWLRTPFLRCARLKAGMRSWCWRIFAYRYQRVTPCAPFAFVFTSCRFLAPFSSSQARAPPTTLNRCFAARTLSPLHSLHKITSLLRCAFRRLFLLLCCLSLCTAHSPPLAYCLRSPRHLISAISLTASARSAALYFTIFSRRISLARFGAHFLFALSPTATSAGYVTPSGTAHRLVTSSATATLFPIAKENDGVTAESLG